MCQIKAINCDQVYKTNGSMRDSLWANKSHFIAQLEVKYTLPLQFIPLLQKIFAYEAET